MTDSNPILEKLAQDTTSGDRAVLERKRFILEQCSTKEMSVQDLAEDLKMNYFTVRQSIKELEAVGLLKLSPRKDGKKYLYHTDWDIIKTTPEELRVKSSKGEWVALSEWATRFLSVREDVAQDIGFVGEALIALWIDHAREEAGQEYYGEDYREWLRSGLSGVGEFLGALQYVIEQLATSPVWAGEGANLMYNLPVGRDSGEETHQALFLRFMNDSL